MTCIAQASQLEEVILRGCRPRHQWALGLEYEQFVTRPDGQPVPYEGPGGLEEILGHLQTWTGWQPISENGRLLGLKGQDGRSITLEPGAQIEFGGAPQKEIAGVQAEVQEYFQWLRRLREMYDIRFVAIGAQPAVAPEQIQRLPKARYDIMEPYLQGVGGLGIWMMKATAGVQVNFDFESPEDGALKMRTAFALSPVLTALFANSPIRAGEDSGFATWRGHVWSRTDPARCGIPEACVREDSQIADFVEWALDVPMLFLQRDGALVDMRGWSFRRYLDQGAQGLTATEADWDLHLSTVFPEIRFRPQLELRCLDTQCPDGALALCALTKGLFYDPEALEQAWQLTAGWSYQDRQRTWHAAHRLGLAAPAPGGGRLLDLARELLALVRLSDQEATYLRPLQGLLNAGFSDGELHSQRFQGEWQGSLEKLVEATACLGS
ncbi:MAG: hypothetical protein DWQ01_13345 [Planctomycetota bacterium]|nr:MAG: hypothetical protein DWQ01_13345 [Planctomycetota bacterium]